jgi:hypothetical protein
VKQWNSCWTCARGSRALAKEWFWAVDRDLAVGSPLFPPKTLAAPSLKAPCGQPPPFPPFGRHPPPIFPLLSSPSAAAAPSPFSSFFCSSHLLNPSRRPPSPLLQVSFFLVGSSLCGSKFQLENWWEEGRRKKVELKVILKLSMFLR